MVFGILPNRTGWRIDYLGMSTPVEELTRTADARHPDLVVLAATLTGNLGPLAAQLTALVRRAPLALAEAGATPQVATSVGPGRHGDLFRVFQVDVLLDDRSGSPRSGGASGWRRR
jgi:methanogenic corrinoid protein MtbC1